VGTGGRRSDRTPRPSRVCASSNTRVARPWWRPAGPESPLAEASAERRARHSPGRGKPAMRDRRVRHSPGWERRATDTVVPPPAVLSSRKPRRQPLEWPGGAGRLHQAGRAFSDGLLAWEQRRQAHRPCAQKMRCKLSGFPVALQRIRLAPCDPIYEPAPMLWK
jgi:hypothetical protein